MSSYVFHSAVMLRAPAYSLTKYVLADLGGVISDPFFKKAVFLANPKFYQLLELKSFDLGLLTPKEKLTLSKYYNRMCFRPTPFGAFSGFSLLDWGEAGQLRLIGLGESRLHLQLDQEVSLRLAAALTGQGGDDQEVSLNATLYRVDKEYRFVKTVAGEDASPYTFVLEAMDVNKLLTKLIEKARAGHQTVAGLLEMTVGETDCSLSEAREYLSFLFQVQLLRRGAPANMTGNDYLGLLLGRGAGFESGLYPGIKFLYQRLRAMKIGDMPMLRDLYRDAGRLLDAPFRNVFYSGLERKAFGSLDQRYQDRLREALKVIAKLSRREKPPALERFKQVFVQRFDRRKVPLLEAMDPYHGIGYAELEKTAGATLLEGLDFKAGRQGASPLDWSAVHRVLLSKWQDREILLTDADLAALDEGKGEAAPTLSVMFRVLRDDQLLIEALTGATAVSLIGRFTTWSPQTRSLARELVAREQAANPEVLFAEILQLSDPHADNINRRAVLYDYEIPLNAVSVLTEPQQVSLSDVLISVADGRLVLESASRGKVVVPRLSSAYNYHRNHLAVFRFLCDMQYEGISPLTIPDMEQFFPGLDVYPRLSYRGLILSPAKWYVHADTLGNKQALAELASQLKWPRMVALTRHDQQLVFDLTDPAACGMLVASAKGGGQLQVQEYFPPSDIVIDHAGQPLANQFIAFLYRKEEILKNRTAPSKNVRAADHMLGSKWLYLKIYVHPAVADRLLVKHIAPAMRRLVARYRACWFFVRYRDEDDHIRLRVRTAAEHTGEVIRLLKSRLAGDVRSRMVREYLADTYRPERERYGPDRMAMAEDFFYRSSELVLAYLKRFPALNFPYAEHSLAFVSVLRMTELFIPDLAGQISFLGWMAATFYREFSADKELKIRLDNQYRLIKAELAALLADPAYYRRLKMSGANQDFEQALRKLAAAGDRILLADLIHMHVNRLFPADQRKQELVIYHSLHKYLVTKKNIQQRSRSL